MTTWSRVPNQHLKGREALWYARGRYGSDDFARMDRQRCVIDAMIKQANPANMLARYEEIAKAGKEIVKTDMPQEVLPLMVDLSLRVKDGNVRSVVFKHGVDGFSSPNPDFDLMRKRVKTAIRRDQEGEGVALAVDDQEGEDRVEGVDSTQVRTRRRRQGQRRHRRTRAPTSPRSRRLLSRAR